MKLNKWLFGAAALAMMASCSDNFDGPKNPGMPAEEGQGYIGINLQLPTVKSTRGNDDFGDGNLDEYVVKDAVLLLFQGANEASAVLTGAFSLDEADPSYDTGHPQITRHSVRVAKVTGVNFNEDNNLYALVMVNGVQNGLYNLSDPDADWMWKTTTVDEDGKTVKIGKTVRELQETVLSKVSSTDNKAQISSLYDQTTPGSGYASYIFMTNSPLSTESGGSEAPVNDIDKPLPVLVELNPAVYPNQSLAIANPAGIIHVERAVGKVTCSEFNKSTQLKVTVNGFDYQLDVDQIWWDMAQDMAETYVVRNTNRNLKGTQAISSNYMWRWNYASTALSVADEDRYRMLGESSVTGKIKVEDGVDEDGKKKYKWVSQDYYRPYFCQVPGYNKPKTVNGNSETYEDKVFNKVFMEFDEKNPPVAWNMATGTSVSGPGAFYPFENTFPVEFMKYANTTRVGFWVTFKFNPIANAEGKKGPELNMTNTNFYINGMDKTTLYLDDKYGNDPLTNLAIAQLSDRIKYKAVWDALEAALDTEGTGNISDVNIGDLLTFTYVDNDNAKIEIKSISFKNLDDVLGKYDGKYDDKFANQPEFDFTQNNNEIRTALNNLGTFYKYEGGRAFYEVRIKHFGEDNTPWDGESLASATTIEESYGSDATEEAKKLRNNLYLGRYGIVRNNWYDLSVKVIKNLGHPKDPALWEDNWDDKPDDNKDQYIAVELKVLSWAKRSQDVEF